MPRRTFVGAVLGCSAHISLMAAAFPLSTRTLWAQRATGTLRAREPWGRIEEIADGLWAMISTPLADRTTLSNGGIVRGAREVLTVESFATPDGARWVSDQARQLTGRRPDHLVLTHYHGDHTAGLAGYADFAPNIYSTAATRDRLISGGVEDPVAARLLESVNVVPEGRPTEIDLGGRVVRILPRTGHTSSDLTIEIDEPSVVWCGDLVWNGMFPNYVDATPSKLSLSVRELQRDHATQYVPGHGPMASPTDLDLYLSVLDYVEGIARLSHSQGRGAAEAADGFRFPEAFGEWTMFNPGYPERAIAAWLKELSAG